MSQKISSGWRDVAPEVAMIINRKKNWYCRYADTCQFEKFDQIALPECTYEYQSDGAVITQSGFTYRWGSTKDFVDFFAKAFETLQTIHMVGPGDFEQISDDEVRATFTVIYHSGLAKGVSESYGVQGTGGGHYCETWKRKGSDWFMAELRMNRIYEGK
ncbi:hypothetical protein LQW54_003860 [Pestalotiopsis sp. IQ-011]